MKTKLCIDEWVYVQLSQEAKRKNTSIASVIKILVKKFENDKVSRLCFSGSVRYQRSSDTRSFRQFHLELTQVEYEQFIQLRMICKMSVSLIVAFSCNKYLFQSGRLSFMDNYRLPMFPVHIVIYCNDIYGERMITYFTLPDKLEDHCFIRDS